MSYTGLLTAGLALLILALVSCGGQPQPQTSAPLNTPTDAPTDVAAPGAAGLPSLRDIEELLPALSGRGASYSPADLYRDGADLEALLPSQLVSPVENEPWLTYQTVSITGAGLQGRAYAAYSLWPGDYSGEARISLNWGSAVPAGTALLALANWQSLRWELWPVDASGSVLLPELGSYTAPDGRLLLICMLQKTSLRSLRWIRLGSPAPEPQITGQPLLGRVPFTVQFDGSASTDEGSIAEYLWDPEGDGSFVSSGTDAQFQFEYTQTGDYSAALRVVDNSGVYNTASTTVQARDYVFHSFGDGEQQYGSRVLPAADGSLIISGAMRAGATYAPMLALTEPQAPAVQAFIKVLPGNFEARDCALGPDGAVYLCGTLVRSGGELNAVLQKWNPDGSLVWSREFGSELDREAFRALVCSADSVYVAGEILPEGGALQGLLARISSEGSLQWISVLSEPQSSVFYDLAWLEPEASGEAALHACGGFFAAGDPQALYCSFDNAGNLLASQSLGSAAAAETAFGLLASGSAAAAELCIAGTGSSSGESFSFVSRPGAGGSLIPLAGADSMNLCSLIALSGGGLGLSISAPDLETSQTRNLLLGLSSADFSISSGRVMDFAYGELIFGADMLELNGELALAAGCGGPLPQPLSIELEAQLLAPEWEAVSAQAEELAGLGVGLHSGPALELDNGAFDRQIPGDSDMLFGLLALQ
ncbi:PKD domain-containing protein [bacterium]|nr:PKD domain-containing protein [bacterium]